MAQERKINPWLIAPVVAMAAFMEVLDISIANVALRHIAGDMSASQDESTWILTSYLVTNAMVLPASGWLSTVLGRKNCFLACIAGFSVSSLACGLAPNLYFLIFFRAIQGLTGGGLQPNAQAILADAFPPEKRGMAFSLYGIATVFAPAIGPTLGGWITDNFSWRWVFLINVPVGIMLFGLITALIQDPVELVAERARRLKAGIKIDYLGFSLLIIGLGCLQIMLDKGQEDDWFGSLFITALAIVSAVALISFILWELGQADPIVDLRLFADRNFAFGNMLMLMLGFVLLGSTALLPILVQSQFGYTATSAGLVLSPGGFAIILMLPLVGRFAGRVDPRLFIVAGLIITSATLLYIARISPFTDYSTLMWARVVQGAGLALLFIPINLTAYVNVPRTKSSAAASIINLSRNLGGAIGISVITTMLARHRQIHQNYLVPHAAPGQPGYDHLMTTLSGHHALAAQAPGLVDPHALSQVYARVQDQASMLSFLDGFQFMGIAFLVLAPIVLLMKRPPIGAAGPRGAH